MSSSEGRFPIGCKICLTILVAYLISRDGGIENSKNAENEMQGALHNKNGGDNLLRTGYVGFVMMVLMWIFTERALPIREKNYAKWKPPKIIKFLYPKDTRVVTLYNMVFSVVAFCLSIWYQIKYIYWWSIGETREFVQHPGLVLLGLWAINGFLGVWFYYLAYRRSRSFMRRKNRYKF